MYGTERVNAENWVPQNGVKNDFFKKYFFLVEKLLLRTIYSQSFIKIGDIGVFSISRSVLELLPPPSIRHTYILVHISGTVWATDLRFWHNISSNITLRNQWLYKWFDVPGKSVPNKRPGGLINFFSEDPPPSIIPWSCIRHGRVTFNCCFSSPTRTAYN